MRQSVTTAWADGTWGNSLQEGDINWLFFYSWGTMDVSSSSTWFVPFRDIPLDLFVVAGPDKTNGELYACPNPPLKYHLHSSSRRAFEVRECVFFFRWVFFCVVFEGSVEALKFLGLLRSPFFPGFQPLTKCQLFQPAGLRESTEC